VRVIIPVYLFTGFTLPCIPPHCHPEKFCRSRQFRADRAHAEQPDRFSSQRSRCRLVPLMRLLGFETFQDFPLMQQQVAKHIFRHQPAKDPAGIRQGVITAQGRVEQRFNPCPNRLDPFQVGQFRQNLADAGRFAEDNLTLRGWLCDDLEPGQIGRFK